jgi:hypothetical protein
MFLLYIIMDIVQKPPGETKFLHLKDRLNLTRTEGSTNLQFVVVKFLGEANVPGLKSHPVYLLHYGGHLFFAHAEKAPGRTEEHILQDIHHLPGTYAGGAGLTSEGQKFAHFLLKYGPDPGISQEVADGGIMIRLKGQGVP